MVIIASLAGLAGCGRFGFSPTGDPDSGGDDDASPGSITAGKYFVCAVRSGAVWCWGDDHNGQLGNNATAPEPRPVQVVGITDALSVAAGETHACALRSDGSVWCWGNSSDGQLGTAKTADQLVPIAVGGLGVATAIAAGGDHTCARLADATAWCWGQNADGELGTESQVTPVPQQALTDVVQIRGRQSRTPARCAATAAYGAGATTPAASLGDGTRAARAQCRSRCRTCMRRRSSSPATTPVRLDSGRYRCWGDNHDGTLGDGTFQDRSRPVPASSLDRITALGTGSAHVCAVRDGNVVCWGDDDMGELGDQKRDNSSTPVMALSDGHVVALAGGDDLSCALRDDGSVACWGLGSSGQLGNGTIAGWLPQRVPLTAPTAVASGAYHSCAITGQAHDVYCWGYDSEGELGDGGGPPHANPIFANVTNAVQLALGVDHSCALLGDGTVWCWGEDDDGALGNGMFGDDSSPVQVTGLANVSAISAGERFTCAATAGGAFCWGFDDDGELGDGGGASKASPQLVPGVSPLVPTMVAAGGAHACVAASTGAFCWGAGDNGQLGNAAKPTISTAVAVVGAGSGATWTPSQLTAGGQHTCAVDTTGKLRCWGNNGSGQIGNGSSLDRSNPTVLASLGTTVTDVVAGEASTCAQTTSGPRCWGNNFYGQLGDGTTTGHRTPTAVKSLVAAALTAPGKDHSCALSNGEVECWGDNSFGQLGRGTFSIAMTPVEVAFP